MSFIAAAPFNAFAHEMFRCLSPWLERLERDKRHPDDEPISLGRAEILIVGMGRVGAGAYDYLREQDENIVGIDSDPAKIESNVREGRRVAYADAEDPSFWHLLNIDRLRAIMLAVPDLQAKVSAARALRRRGYRGLLSATHMYPEEREPIIEAGCDVTYNYYTEAGVGFARHTYETLRPAAADAATPAKPAKARQGPVAAAASAPLDRIYKVSRRSRPLCRAAPRSYDCALARAACRANESTPAPRRGFTVAISIYDQFVPVFTQMLSALDKVLSKAEADAAARKIDLDVFVNGRLAPDMLPLTRQIQIMTDQAKGCASRLAGQESAEVGRRREDVRRLARARREDDRALEDLQAGAVRRRREARDRDEVPERDVQLHGQGLLAELRDPELLLPLHDGVRDPAAQRRADRQGRLPRQP